MAITFNDRLIDAGHYDITPEQEAENDLERELRRHWSDFCDADPFPESDTFADRMERAGFIELVAVTDEALESSFAADRGIEPGGMMWVLTDAGRDILTATKGD
jgi:hypothetical protein